MGITVSPERMKRAVENSAKHIENVHVLGQGHGLIQVEEAWQMLQMWCPPASSLPSLSTDRLSGDVRFKIAVQSERFTRGIYLRQAEETSNANTYKVDVQPIFHESTPPEQKVQLELRLILRSTASWVTCPDFVMMASGGKLFSVCVDPRSLPAGSVYVAFVRAYIEQRPEIGPIFEIPVTIAKPIIITENVMDLGILSFRPSERIRRFISPPAGCSFIDCVVQDARALNSNTNFISRVVNARIAVTSTRRIPLRRREERN